MLGSISGTMGLSPANANPARPDQEQCETRESRHCVLILTPRPNHKQRAGQKC